MGKRHALALALLLACTAAGAQRITAEKEIHDFGSIIYGFPAMARFELANKGNDLVIEGVHASCGCTQVSYPRQPIPKGNRFYVDVTYDARQLGHFEKDVAIYSNASDKPFYLKVRGVVIAEAEDFTGTYDYELGSVRVDRNNIEFDDVTAGDMPEQMLHILNDGDKDVSPVIMHVPNYLMAAVTPTTIAPGHTGVARLTLDSERLRDYGLTQTSVYLGMFPGDKVGPDKEITVSAVLLPQFKNLSETQRANAPVISLSADTLDLGRYSDRSVRGGTIVIENHGLSTLVISSMQMFTHGLKVRLGKSRIAPGESAKLKITADKKQLRTARGRPRVLMITNDPDNPKVVVHVNVSD